jgi:hypothetical protein
MANYKYGLIPGLIGFLVTIAAGIIAADSLLSDLPGTAASISAIGTLLASTTEPAAQPTMPTPIMPMPAASALPQAIQIITPDSLGSQEQASCASAPNTPNLSATASMDQVAQAVQNMASTANCP